jgi:hypothetical protein
MMTQNERKARKMFRELLAHYGGDMKRLEMALWREVKRRGKLPMINTRRTGAPLKPYRTPEA